MKATCGGLHGGSPAQFQRAAFAVASDAEMGAQALQCWLGFVLEGGWDGAVARGCPDLDLGGLLLEVDSASGVGNELDCCWDVSWFDPNVPLV